MNTPKPSRMPVMLLAGFLLAGLTAAPGAEPVFLEAESFTLSSDGWRVSTNAQARRASAATALNGAAGPGDALASHPVAIGVAGSYRVWVRYMQHAKWRGPFQLAIRHGDAELAAKTFDLEADPKTEDWEYRWDYLDADLPEGEVALQLAKHQKRNATGYVRNVDCVLITTNRALVPDHMDYGPQTYLRVTLGQGYDKPLYIHVFADHYRSPWYAHFNLSKNGTGQGLRPKNEFLLKAGEATPWCNITPMLYQDSGAILTLSPRHTYQEQAPRLAATLEFATAPDPAAVVRTLAEDREPGGLVVIVPPNLLTPENRSRLTLDRDAAETFGRQADAFAWPTFGKAPEVFPFFVAAHIGGPGSRIGRDIVDREWKTLDYFGFANRRLRHIGGGMWHMISNSYCRPDLAKMRAAAQREAGEFKTNGFGVSTIAYAMVMDEPGGQSAAFMARDPAYLEAFRAWLRDQGRTPESLQAADWDAVRPVTEAERETLPTLFYQTQKFRTAALGRFLVLQQELLTNAYGATFPVVANFSDGATYHANFYSQGVDYFELLESGGPNAIWSEDWANGASTYQCSTYNVELMRAAARRNGQTLGHHLIAYAGRKPGDVKLKAVGQLARGVKILDSFFYGPCWNSHEGGPFWKSTAWQAKPELWRAHAELLREIGWAEDFLVPARPAPADTAILYASSSDIWTAGLNYAAGFERMHTWLALAHAQVPADFLSERDVADGELDRYKVCYASGPNLTRAAAAKLAEWVRAGGTLWLTADAASRDETNQPMTLLDDLLPAERSSATTLQAFTSSGRYLTTLEPKDRVQAGPTSLQVLSLRQALPARTNATVLAVFEDQSPALVQGSAGKGTVWVAGFLPALHYIKAALDARQALSAERADPALQPEEATVGEFEEAALLKQSYNPWAFPAAAREFLLQPVRAAAVAPPIRCSVPLVDAILMTCDKGFLITLANYTLTPIARLELSVRTPREVARIESARQGDIPFTPDGKGSVTFSLPLNDTDFVKLHPK